MALHKGRPTSEEKENFVRHLVRSPIIPMPAWRLGAAYAAAVPEARGEYEALKARAHAFYAAGGEEEGIAARGGSAGGEGGRVQGMIAQPPVPQAQVQAQEQHGMPASPIHHSTFLSGLLQPLHLSPTPPPPTPSHPCPPSATSFLPCRTARGLQGGRPAPVMSTVSSPSCSPAWAHGMQQCAGWWMS